MTFQFSRTIVGLLFVSFICLALTFMSGCGGGNNGGANAVFAQSGGATVTRWEYKVEAYVSDRAQAEALFNRLGAEGWEFVSQGGGNYLFYFKRPRR